MDNTQRKILYVITKANWGGAQRYVFELAVAMKERGDDVVVAYGEEGLLVKRLQEVGVRTREITALARDFNWKSEWTALRTLITLIKEEAPDIVHVNSSKGGLALLAARIGRVSHIIFTTHGWAFNEARPWWQRMLIHLVYAITVLLSHKTICVSDAIRRDLAWFPDFLGRFVVVRNGLPSPTFLTKEEARERLGIPQSTAFVLGMIAELHPIKRVDDAIRALAELTPHHPELSLVVIGDGKEHAWLSEYAAHYDVAERVYLKGFIESAATYLKAFDVFLMPSRSEALALALIEAGYARLPVVASRVGGIPEVITHKKTGLLVPRENPHALARALREMIEHPDQAALYGEALHKSVRERFSSERMLTETFRVYDKNP
ncbi:MAG: glycosyltransferase [Minisyncoccia bacterium]